MSNQVTLERLEQQIAQLSPHEQLKLMAHIAERLSAIPSDMLQVVGEEDVLRRQCEREADELLALCDAAAEMWEGEFNAAEEIRQMRKERDEQICSLRSPTCLPCLPVCRAYGTGRRHRQAASPYGSRSLPLSEAKGSPTTSSYGMNKS